MKPPTLGVYLFGHNLNRILYPYKASIASALALVGDNGEVYFSICDCDDGTEEDIRFAFREELNRDKLQILYHPWGTHYSIQAHIANYMLDRIEGLGQDEFLLKLDADEVLHEASFDNFREDLWNMQAGRALLGRPHYTHICPDDEHEFPFIYSQKSVLSKTGRGLRFDLGKGGDACAIGGAPEVQTRLEVFHYGKMEMGREVEALYKETSFQALYTDLGFPDKKVVALAEGQGYMDYYKVFDRAKAAGEFRKYKGQHPIFVQPWLEEMRERSAKFWADRDNQHG